MKQMGVVGPNCIRRVEREDIVGCYGMGKVGPAYGRGDSVGSQSMGKWDQPMSGGMGWDGREEE